MHTDSKKINLNTAIDNLGSAKINSNLKFCRFIEDKQYPFYLDNEFLDDLTEPQLVKFELAGPREKLFFDSSKTRCAIVTCGGLCPGINDVIRAIVMEAFHGYKVLAVLGIRYGLEGFIPKYKHEVIELNPDKVAPIHQFGGTILGTSRGPQEPAEIVDAIERMNINMLFLIGGDGTMKAAASIDKEAKRRNIRLAVIGIPKTIDNDINFITQSFGFETAVDKATEAIQCAHTEAIGAYNGIGIVKLMGRESGFIAAHAAMSIKEANFVLVPEVKFQLQENGGLLPAIEQRLNKRNHAVIVVAEGAGQHLLSETNEKDPSGNIILANITDFLLKEIKQYFKSKNTPITIKTIDPSYIIRSIPAAANDRVYCGLLGQSAIHAAMAGKTNMVVAKLMDRYVHVPLSLVTQKRRKLNIHSDYWRAVLEATGQGDLKGMLPTANEDEN